MPIYEYTCDACGHGMESLQKMSDPPLTDCPQCGKPALRKLISAAGFQLKGSGWYVTDFKGGNAKKDGKDTKDTKDTKEDKADKSGGDEAPKATGCGAGACPACAD